MIAKVRASRGLKEPWVRRRSEVRTGVARWEISVMRLLKSTALSLVIAGAASIVGFASPAFANTCTALGSVVTVPACYFFPPSLTSSGATYTADFKVTGPAFLKIFAADGAGDDITSATLTGPGATQNSVALSGPTFNGLWHVTGGSSNLYDLTITFATPL